MNEDRTLYEVSDRDAWQAELITRDGQRLGRVVRQVVEPESYMVRYLIVYCPTNGRRLLFPASAVVDIEAGEIHSVLSSVDAERLPDYATAELTRAIEWEVYNAVNRTPHWVEEARLEK